MRLKWDHCRSSTPYGNVTRRNIISETVIFFALGEYDFKKGVKTMGKLKSILIGAAAICCAVLSGTSTAAGEFVRNAAYLSAGVVDEEGSVSSETSADESSVPTESSHISESVPETSTESSSASASYSSSNTSADAESSASDSIVTSTPPPAPQKRGKVITKNRVDGTDDEDYSQYTNKSGIIERLNFGYFDNPNIITLSSGAQIRNLTEDTNEDLLAASAELPELGSFEGFKLGSEEPQVLIYHTHTSESFLPGGDSFDPEYPIRSSDDSRNMIAIGDAICNALAERGVSCVHDCRVHDYPMFTGAYYRSADTMLEDLEEYPSIKIAIDIHRDGILNSDGTAIAPIAEINGKTAAQFMIITGCDSPETEIPEYMTNFKLSCLLQNCAETAYPTLARPMLFDYRNYNQSLFAGDLLIEVGSQGNTLDEALYTGELIGNVLADAVERLAAPE